MYQLVKTMIFGKAKVVSVVASGNDPKPLRNARKRFKDRNEKDVFYSVILVQKIFL